MLEHAQEMTKYPQPESIPTVSTYFDTLYPFTVACFRFPVYEVNRHGLSFLL